MRSRLPKPDPNRKYAIDEILSQAAKAREQEPFEVTFISTSDHGQRYVAEAKGVLKDTKDWHPVLYGPQPDRGRFALYLLGLVPLWDDRPIHFRIWDRVENTRSEPEEAP